jgi:hypothetical protein
LCHHPHNTNIRAAVGKHIKINAPNLVCSHEVSEINILCYLLLIISKTLKQSYLESLAMLMGRLYKDKESF